MELAQIQQKQLKLDIELEIHQKKYMDHLQQSSWHKSKKLCFNAAFQVAASCVRPAACA